MEYNWVIIVKIFIVIIALAGAWLNARGSWLGFVLWLITNGYWCGYNIKHAEYAQAVLFGVFWMLCLYGIWKWNVNDIRRFGDLQNAKAFNKAFLSKVMYENTVMAQAISRLPKSKVRMMRQDAKQQRKRLRRKQPPGKK